MNLDKIVKKDFSGCVFVKHKGRIVFERAYGYADMANKVPNETDTKFPTASAGKAFVAVGILQLVERGMLKLSDTIGRLLDIDFMSIDTDITVKQLLTHMSGMPDYFDESVMKDYAGLWKDFPNYRVRKNADLIPLFSGKPMMSPKGERFHYNNAGYVMLGLIIESLSGQPFDEFLRYNVFRPCGMMNTGYFEMDRLPAKCANAYLWDDRRQEYYTNVYSVDAKGTGAGGAYTTVSNIDRFWTGLFEEKLISDELTSEMMKPHSGDGRKRYGYGVWLDKARDEPAPYMQGQDPGVSFISGCTAGDCVITAVSNKGDDVIELWSELLKAAVRL